MRSALGQLWAEQWRRALTRSVAFFRRWRTLPDALLSSGWLWDPPRRRSLRVHLAWPCLPLRNTFRCSSNAASCDRARKGACAAFISFRSRSQPPKTGWLHSGRFGTNASISCKTTWKVLRHRNADALRNGDDSSKVGRIARSATRSDSTPPSEDRCRVLESALGPHSK